MKKRFLSMLLCLVMLAGILPAGTMANEAEDIPTGEIKAEEILDAEEITDAEKEENENKTDKLNVKDASVDTNEKAVLFSADANAVADCAEVTIGEDRKKYPTLYEAAEAVKGCTENDGATIKLLSDVKLDQSFYYESSSATAALIIDGGTFTLDLNNFTISHTKMTSCLILVTDGNVTVKNGKLDLSSNADRCAIWMRGGTAHLVSVEAQSDSITNIVEVYKPSTVTVEDCNFTAKTDAIFINGGDLTIKSGTFTGNRSGVIAYHYSGSAPTTVKVYDGAFNTAETVGDNSYNYGFCADPTYDTIKLYGGTFNSISTCNSNLPVAELLADGYALFDSDTNELFDASAAQINKKLKIGEHNSHDFGADAKCACGYTCHHDNVTADENGKVSCNICNQDMDVKVELNGKTTYDSDINHAIANASDNSRLTVISEKRPLNIQKNLSIPKNITFYLDINGRSLSQHPLKIADGKLVAEDSKGGGQIGFEVHDGGMLDFCAKNVQTTITGLDVYGGSVKLYGGNIARTNVPVFKNGVKLTDFLPEGYVYYSYYGLGSLGIPLKASDVENASILQRYRLAVQPCTHEGDSISSSGTCEYCGTTLTVKLTHGESTSYYQSLDKALENAADGDIVTLLADTTAAAEITKSITIDLGGHTLTGKSGKFTTYPALEIKSKNVTLKNGKVTDFKYAVKVEGTGSLNVDGDVTLEGFYSIEARSGAKVSLSIGTVAIGSLSDNNKNIYGMIPKNAVLQKLDKDGKLTNDYYTYEDLKTKLTIDDSFKVVEHTSHTYESGRCKYCGSVCKHESVDEDTRKCGTCGAAMTASVWLNSDKPFSETPIYVWYITPEEAFASIKPADGLRRVTYYGNHTLTNNVEISGNVICYADNTASLNFSDGKSFVVKKGGRLQPAGRGYTGAVTVESGGDFYIQEANNKVGSLTVYDGSELFSGSSLLYGHFDEIKIADGEKTIADMLPTTRTLRYDDNSWPSDTALSEKTIRNVTVVKKPFYGENITADKDSLDFNGADTGAELTAKITEDETNRNFTTYTWYLVKGNDETEVQSGANNKLEISFSAVGEYTYKCEISKDGYTRTATKTITVNKGTPAYTPTANDPVYNGEEQELISGTLGTGQKIWYRLGDDGDWSESIPKATDAGEYTVYYKVDENYNYNGIAAAKVEATIKKQVLKGIKTEPIAKQYDGSKNLPMSFSISSFICADNTEINPPNGISWEGSYTSQAADKNNNVTITVNLGKAAKNYVFDNDKAEKVFTLTGTIEKAKAPQQKDGELTIVKEHERVYEYDLSQLLGNVSKDKPYGEIEYGEPHVDMPHYYDENKRATIENGILKLPIKSNTQTGDGAGTVTVTVKTDNYYNYYYDGVNITDRDITLTVKVKAMDKIQLDLSGKPTLNPGKITYGQKLSDIALSGSLKGYDGKTVEGTFAWTNPDTMPNAGNASAEWNFTPNDKYYMYTNGNGIGSADFTVEPKDITGASTAIGDFNLEYNGSAQTPTAKVTVDGMEVTGVWSKVTNVSDKTTFTANGNFKGTIENIETGMKAKDISSAEIDLAESPEYNGSEQTQGITRITVDGIALSDSDYTVSGNTATDVGENTLTIEGKGNFSGKAEKKWSLRKKNYDGINKEKSVSVRCDKQMSISVELPNIPSGASYGTAKLSRAKYADGTDYEYNIFPSGQRGIEGNILYITVDPSQPGIYADITVPVIGAANYNDYDITICLTRVNRSEVTFGGVEDNQTFVYDGTAKAPDTNDMTLSYNVDKNTLEVKYGKVTESGTTDISASEITEAGTYNVTYSVPDTNNEYMGSITYTFTIDPRSIDNADVILAESPEYNGSEQTQGIASITVYGLTLSEKDYTIVSGAAAANVKTDGKYVISIAGKGNFTGTKTAEWNIKPTAPIESTEKKTTAKVRRGRSLENAAVTYGELFGIDKTTVLEGTFAWIDKDKPANADGTEQMTFTPNNKNYAPITIDVAVSTFSSGGGSSASSTVYTVKFDTNGGNVIKSQSVKKNNTVTEPAIPLKDGFSFDGWFTDKALKNKYDFTAQVTADLTLYAAWTEAETEQNPTDKPENPEKEEPFDDVSKDDWYYDDVKSAVEKGLFNGTGSKTFSPNDSITRGMFVTVLYRAEGEPKADAAIPFDDISADSYYANAVIWAAKNEIVKGVSETEFAPNEKITREQIAAILYRFAKYKGYDVTQGGMQIREFNDFESISGYAAAAMTWAVNTGLMKGKTETSINPQDNATRAEIAAILNRFIIINK